MSGSNPHLQLPDATMAYRRGPEVLTATSGIADIRACYNHDSRDLFNLAMNAQSAAEAHLALNLLVGDVPERALVAAVNLREVLGELPTSPFSMCVDEETLIRALGWERSMACIGTVLPDGLELAVTTAGNLVLDVIVRDEDEKYFLTPIPRIEDFVSPNLMPLLVESEYLLDAIIDLVKAMGMVFNPKFFLSTEDWRLDYAQDAMAGLGELF
jgi:hypothetical protein